MNKIKVSTQFKKAFDDYCYLYSMSEDEIEDVKSLVRSDFSVHGGFIEYHMKAYKWAYSEFEGDITESKMIDYLFKRNWPVDNSFYGIDILMHFCYDVSEMCI